MVTLPAMDLSLLRLDSVGSDHQNQYNDLAVADIPGTPGVGIYIGGSYLASNQDVADSSWSNIHVYPGITSYVVTGILQDGIQSEQQIFFGNNTISKTSSRGIDIEAGNFRISGFDISGPSTGANVDDIYIAAAAYWGTIENCYHEITASDNPLTRHAMNFPAGTRPYSTLLSGNRVYWTLTSGNPIYSAQIGAPFTLVGNNFDGEPSGQSTIYFKNSSADTNGANAIVNLIGNHVGNIYTKIFVTGNYAVRIRSNGPGHQEATWKIFRAIAILPYRWELMDGTT